MSEPKKNTILFFYKNGRELEISCETLGCGEEDVRARFEIIKDLYRDEKVTKTTVIFSVNAVIILEDLNFILFNPDTE